LAQDKVVEHTEQELEAAVELRLRVDCLQWAVGVV
jgi:hypothetical protein